MVQLHKENIPSLPFYVIILVQDTIVLWTKSEKTWKEEILVRKEQSVVYFPVIHASALQQLQTHYD